MKSPKAAVLILVLSFLTTGCNPLTDGSSTDDGADSTNKASALNEPLVPVEIEFVYEYLFTPVVTPDGSQLLVFDVEKVNVLGNDIDLATKMFIYDLQPPYEITTLEIPGGATPGVHFIEDGAYAVLPSPNFALANPLNLSERKFEDYINQVPRNSTYSSSEALVLGFTVSGDGGANKLTPVLRGFRDPSRNVDFNEIDGYATAFSKSGNAIFILGRNLENNRQGVYRAATSDPLNGEWIYISQITGSGTTQIQHLNNDGTAAMVESVIGGNYTYALINTAISADVPAFELSLDTSGTSFSEDEISTFNFLTSLISDQKASYSWDSRYLILNNQILDLEAGELKWFREGEPQIPGQVFSVDSLELSLWIDPNSRKAHEILWESREFGRSFDLPNLADASLYELRLAGSNLVVLAYQTNPTSGQRVALTAITIDLVTLVGTKTK